MAPQIFTVLPKILATRRTDDGQTQNLNSMAWALPILECGIAKKDIRNTSDLLLKV